MKSIHQTVPLLKSPIRSSFLTEWARYWSGFPAPSIDFSFSALNQVIYVDGTSGTVYFPSRGRPPHSHMRGLKPFFNFPFIKSDHAVGFHAGNLALTDPGIDRFVLHPKPCRDVF